jgi:spoIIIJ-associated protein
LTELEVSARTVDEATRVALGQLGVSRKDVEIIILKKGKSGVLGMGSEDARIKVIVLNENQQISNSLSEDDICKQVLSKLLQAMGMSADITVSREADADAPMTLNIEGDDLGVLIGRRGQALSALQYIVRLIVAEKTKKWISINVDVDWYKKRHYDGLKKLAYRLAEQVAKRRRLITMEPMPPDERRIIHMTLSNNPEVMTQSTGEGEGRRIVIQPRKR